MIDDKKRIKDLEQELEQSKKEIERLKKVEEEYKEHKHHCKILDKKLPVFVKHDLFKRHKTPGQKLGHVGYSRKIPERIDFVRRLILDSCPECQGNNLSKIQEVRERIVEDIPEITNTIITKYEIERKYCRNCKKIVELEVQDVLKNSRFGLRVMLLVTFMKLGLALPSQKITRMLQAQYNLTISDGGIYKILEQVAETFGKYYQELLQKIRESPVKNIDETGWRIAGKNHWVWIFINKECVLYTIRKQRSSNIPIRILGCQKNNIVVNDRYSAYNILAKKTKCLLQICWAHLLRNTKDLAEHYKEAKYLHKRFKTIFKQSNKYQHLATKEQVEDLLHKIDIVSEKRYKHSEVRKFIKSVCKNHRENLFRFVTNPEVEPTNNRAERGIRKAVIIRKISNGNRSKKGANILSILLSIVETIRIQGKNPLKEMQNIIQASRT